MRPPRGTRHAGAVLPFDALVPSDQDLAVLTGLGLTAVYDVRTVEEVAAKPDRLPAGPRYQGIPILSGDLGAAVAQLKSPADAVAFMQQMNRSFVDDAATRAGFAQLLTSLADTDGPQIFHCTAGKDRTGWRPRCCSPSPAFRRTRSSTTICSPTNTPRRR